MIPVTEEDYYKTKRFNNVNELQTFRDQTRRDLHKQTSKAEQEHIYQQAKMRQEEEDTRITLHLPPSPIKLQVEEIA